MLVAHPVLSYYPKAEIDIKNTKIPNRKASDLDDNWLKFLQDNPENLKPKGKKYSIDQFCRYTIESTENGELLYNTLKLVKQKRENPGFNLQGIEFLRNQNLKFKKKKANKPLTIDFKYYAF